MKHWGAQNAHKTNMIEKIKTQRDYLSSEFGIERIGLFGSVAAGTDNDRSDIDLVVEFRRLLVVSRKVIPPYRGRK